MYYNDRQKASHISLLTQHTKVSCSKFYWVGQKVSLVIFAIILSIASKFS